MLKVINRVVDKAASYDYVTEALIPIVVVVIFWSTAFIPIMNLSGALIVLFYTVSGAILSLFTYGFIRRYKVGGAPVKTEPDANTDRHSAFSDPDNSRFVVKLVAKKHLLFNYGYKVLVRDNETGKTKASTTGGDTEPHARIAAYSAALKLKDTFLSEDKMRSTPVIIYSLD